MPRRADPDQQPPQRPPCPTCHGATQVQAERPDGTTEWVTCPRCHGTGQL
jgi:DnaJ-class molecular chaperone